MAIKNIFGIKMYVLVPLNFKYLLGTCSKLALDLRRLLSVRFAVRVTMVHVLAIGTRMREPFETFTALERLFAAVKALVLR